MAAATLALGIGANTAIFSVVNAVLLAPLPYREPDRLAMVWATNPTKGIDAMGVSAGVYSEWKAGAIRVFEAMAPSTDMLYTLTGAGDPQLLLAYEFAADYFQLLGAAPQLGRTFTAEEDRPGGPNVAVLSDSLWRRTFHADPGILGKSVNLSGTPYTVIGVMPPTFQIPTMVEIWTPLALNPASLGDYRNSRLRVMARLKPGVTPSQAQAAMKAIEDRIAQQHPDTDAGNGVKLTPLRDQIAGDVRKPLLILVGAVGFVLMIACANVGNLLLVRAAGRRKEVAIRTALGAGRDRLVRQFLTEGALLSLIGGALGLALAYWAKGLLLAIFPHNIANLSIPEVTTIPLDARVFGFAVLLTGFAAAIFGLAPLAQHGKAESGQSLKESGRGATQGRSVRRLRSILAAAEISLALILLAGAGLLIESFRNILQQDLGFHAENVLSAQLFLLGGHFPFSQPDKRVTFVNEVIARAHSLPGVQSVAAINFLPLSGFSGSATLAAEGMARAAPGHELTADALLVTPDYFQTMGIALLKGRDFGLQDRKGLPQVTIVSQALARQIWGSQDPIGRRLNFGDAQQPSWWTVVGVVGDVRTNGLAEKSNLAIYRPFSQISFPLVSFVVRTAGRPMSLAPAFEKTVWSIEPEQPFFKVLALQQLADESLALRRISMMLLAVFSGLAALLAAVGIYGVMAYSIAQRTHEIGLRMALGAPRAEVLRMTMGQGVRIVIPGLSAGLLGSFALTRLMTGLLFNVRASDPGTFAAVSILLGGVALAATYIPARRATRIDPVIALRCE